MSEEIIVTVLQGDDPIIVNVLPFEGVGGVTSHPALTDRELADQHPASAISIDGTAFENVQELADYVDDSDELNFDPETIIGTGSVADPYSVDRRVQFFEPEQEVAFTITASMLFKLVYINSATDVEVTVDNMVVGSWIPFDTLGAGLPVFVDGVGDNIFPDEDFTGATSFILIRLENDGATERYGVKYG